MIKHALRRPLANAAKSPVITKRFAHAPVAFNWEDPLISANLFTEEEVAIQETANSYCQERMLPRVLGVHLSHLLCSSHTKSQARCIPK